MENIRMKLKIMEQNYRTLVQGLSPHSFPHVVYVAPGRDISISDRETYETIMRKQASLINNRPTLKALRHVGKKKFMDKVHRLDKIIANVKIQSISGTE